MNVMLCLIKVNSNTIELRVHSSCYWVLDLLCVILLDRYFTMIVKVTLGICFIELLPTISIKCNHQVKSEAN